MHKRLFPIFAFTALCMAGCTAPSNVAGGADASHVQTSACEGDRAYCECVNTAEVSGVSTEEAKFACAQ